MSNTVLKAFVCVSMLIAGLLSAQNTRAQSTVTINGTICTGNWSITSTPSNTAINVPASCISAPAPVCNGPPIISSFQPTSGPVGTTITVTGVNLCPGILEVNAVRVSSFDGGGTSLTMRVPPSATGTGTVIVATTTGIATSDQRFTVTTSPGIVSVTPAAALPGASVSINGANFATGATVTIGGVAAVVSSVTPQAINATIPSTLTAGTTVQVVVTSGGIQSASFGYTLGGGAQLSGYFSVEGTQIPDPSKDFPGLPAPARPGQLNGAGSFMNAYAVDLTRLPNQRCGVATPPVTRLWWHNIDFAKYQSSGAPETPELTAGEAMTWKFVAPATGGNFFTYDTGGNGSIAPGFMSISEAPCDFDTSKVLTAPACYRSGNSIGMYWKSTSGTAEAYECRLQPGQTYFVNLRMQDARTGTSNVDACVNRGFCGGSVQIR
jgi:hypothetical protein